jgi:oxalate decarboxylase/phosphoglucose isomerase-like protein (cupin superfamily)
MLAEKLNALSTAPVLTNEEDTFCLGVIEFGGNLPAAWRAAFPDDSGHNAGAKARMMLSRPEVAKRIRQLTEVVEEHAYISLGSHLVELANIRDISKTAGQLKVALSAEMARGQVAGFYKKDEGPSDKGGASVHIHMPGSTPASVTEWAQRTSGTTPVIIDNATGRVVDAKMTAGDG